jgi:C-terminal peptidase prc
MAMAKSLRFLGVLVAALVVVLPARAEEKAAPKTYVVVVGVGKYADDQIKQRPHAEDDARALFDLLTDKQYVAVNKADAHLLVGRDATHEKILSTLKEVVAKAKPQDLVLFVFIGNGAPLGDAGDRRCYLASDSTFAGREKDAVAASEIGDILKNLKAQHFAGFVDVDFKGYNAKVPISDARLGEAPYKEFLGDDGSDDHLSIPGRILFLATNGLHPSLDLEKHGLFTHVLLDGLKGGADKEGYEPDGLVTVDELSTYFEKNLPDLARKHGKTNEEKTQQHFVLGRGSHYVLTSNPAASALRQTRLDALAKLAADGKVPATLAEEGRILLDRMPKLEQRRELRKAYQSFADGKIGLDGLKDQRDTILAKMKLDATDAVRYAKKVMEVVDLIRDKHIKKVTSAELVVWAVRGLYRRLDEPVPAEVDAKLKSAKDLDDEKLQLLLAEVRQLLGKREDLDKFKDVDFTLQTMLRNLDPYTTYIDPDQLERFKQETQGFFTGIGISIRKDNVSDRLLVVTPIKGSPAYKTGLEAGDIITTVTREVDSNGDPLNTPEVIDTKGLQLSDAVKKILGKAGTKVKLTVERDGKPITFELTRARVQTESVLGVKRLPNDDWDYMLDENNKIAYIRLTSFQRNTADDLRKVMEDLTKKKGIKGFILDLRFNPGGLLDSAVEISDLFIDDGLIVAVRERGQPEKRFAGFREGTLPDFPMAVLVNGLSASASEIVSAALQDHKRAYIVGDRSYGKGSVQNIKRLYMWNREVFGEVKLTTASWWRPNGKNLDKASTGGKPEDEWGVTPDKVVKLTPKETDDLFEAQHEAEIIRRGKPAKEVKEFRDKQLEAALDYVREQVKLTAKLPVKEKQ